MAEEIAQVLANPTLVQLILYSIILNIFFTVVGGIINIILRIQEFFLYRELKQYDIINYKRFKSTAKTVWWKRLFR